MIVGDSVRACSPSCFRTSIDVARAAILNIHIALSVSQYLVVDSGEGDDAPLIRID